MMSSGLHSSSSDPPSMSMFTHAGRNHGNNKITSDASTPVLSQFTSALLPHPPTEPSSMSDSVGKMIENQLKCYRQLGELQNIPESGLISEGEYVYEKKCIMGIYTKNFGYTIKRQLFYFMYMVDTGVIH